MKRKLDQSNHFYRAVFEVCEKCTTQNNLNGEGDHIFKVTRVGNETNQISIIHQSKEGSLCLSYVESVGLFFLPCHLVKKNAHIFKKVAYNIHPLSNSNASILTIAMNASASNMYLNIIGDSSTCMMSRSNEECAKKDPNKPIFDNSGSCRARSESDCPAHQVLENGACRDRIQNDCKDRRKLKDGKCSECEDMFVLDGNNCVPGCPNGQFLIYDQSGITPKSCSDGTQGVYKIKLSDDNVLNNYLATHSGSVGCCIRWNWNTFSKDSSYNDGWKFRIGPNRGLNTEDGRAISVNHEAYTNGGLNKERIWTIKDWGDMNQQIILNTNDHGRTFRFHKKDRNPDEDCATNGPEDSLKYGFGGDCNNQARYTFKLIAA